MKIKLSIKTNQPITLILGMGWGKNWHSYSAPHINWAEIFHLKFLFDTFGLISKIYEPGIVIDITPDDIAVQLINNYKTEWLGVYKKEFLQLLKFFNSQTPNNFIYKFTPSSLWYTRSMLKREIDNEVIEIKKNSVKAKEIIKSRLHNAENNIVLPANISDKEKQKAIGNSILIHRAWLGVDYKHRKEYLEGGINIPIAHRRGVPGTYNLRNLPSSLVQFWKGDGICKWHKNKYSWDIVSPNRWKKLKSIEYIKVNNPTLLSQFDTIPVYKVN